MPVGVQRGRLGARAAVSAYFGNRELAVNDLLRLTALAGPIREDEEQGDTLFLRFEREQYTRAEVLELVQIIARIQPDECDMSQDDLRLWWD